MTTPALVRKSLHITTAAVPLAGWTLHALVMRRRLTAAHRDPLTRAWRRDAFTARAHRMLTHHHDLTLLLADLDDFKGINDTYGHAAGDDVLAAVAARLADWAGSRGVVGRLGGDEFAVLAPLTAQHHEHGFDRLLHTLARPIATGGTQLHIGVSLGAASPSTLGTRDLAQLLRAADAAMYEGKHSGRIIHARPHHAAAPSINGRRVGRPGTHTPERAA
jgi:diguanylate cyclase (GGDEF)-like protein